MNRVLVLGQGESQQRLVLLLRDLGTDVALAGDRPAAVAALSGAESFDGIFAALEDLQSQELGPKLAGIARVALGSSQQFPELRAALGRGADDVILHPVDRQDLALLLDRPRALGSHRPRESGPIIGVEGGLARAWKVARKAAGFDADILLTGETGTGKELFARAIHDLSKRAEGPFVALNCAAIPEKLFEAELFGHVQGAFTGAHKDRKGYFERAHGGTLFLDEVGELPPALQVKVLRALQSKEVTPVGAEGSHLVDVRVMAATSRALEEMRARGDFRDDLYYRLAVVPIELPPLRERPADLEALIDHFLESYARQHGAERPELSDAARERLMSQPWPGNVRQLQNCIERLVVLGDPRIEAADVLREEQTGAPAVTSSESAPIELGGRSLKEALREAEARLIASALDQCNGRRDQCAELLKISPRSLLYKLKEYGIH